MSFRVSSGQDGAGGKSAVQTGKRIDWIRVCEPDLTGNEEKYLLDAFRSGWLSAGSYVKDFEQAFAAMVSARHAVTTVSGTEALHLALAGLGVSAGDEVILPAFTMVATALAVCYLNATPVLVDSEAETGNIDVRLIEEKISRRTKAIIPVHVYGHPCQMEAILALASQYGLKVIEDAAEAHGALYKGRPVGSIGDAACFSLYANKIITTGEGGMIATSNDALAERLRLLKDFARSKENRFIHTELAYSLRMTNLQAAIGLAQVERIEEFVERKRQIASKYARALADIAGLILPQEKDGCRSVYWMYGIRVTGEFGMTAGALMDALFERQVETRAFFVPLHKQPVFNERGLFLNESYPVAEDFGKKGLYLPSGLSLSDCQIERVAQAIREIQREARS